MWQYKLSVAEEINCIPCLLRDRGFSCKSLQIIKKEYVIVFQFTWKNVIFVICVELTWKKCVYTCIHSQRNYFFFKLCQWLRLTLSILLLTVLSIFWSWLTVLHGSHKNIQLVRSQTFLSFLNWSGPVVWSFLNAFQCFSLNISFFFPYLKSSPWV